MNENLDRAAQARRPAMAAETPGFAMISVLLVIMIFFIITVAISTMVVLHARSTFETALADLSYYVADAGIRQATPRVMYRLLMKQLYGTGQEITTKEVDLATLSSFNEYRANVLVNIYELEPIAPITAEGYNWSNRIAINARIYRMDDPNTIVSQRSIFADIYMFEVPGTAGPPGDPTSFAHVNAAIKRYYEKNR